LMLYVLLGVVPLAVLCRITIDIFWFSQMQALFFKYLRWRYTKSHRTLSGSFEGRNICLTLFFTV
jgi:hypothetical protein